MSAYRLNLRLQQKWVRIKVERRTCYLCM